jgi:hypothetical protein
MNLRRNIERKRRRQRRQKEWGARPRIRTTAHRNWKIHRSPGISSEEAVNIASQLMPPPDLDNSETPGAQFFNDHHTPMENE